MISFAKMSEKASWGSTLLTWLQSFGTGVQPETPKGRALIEQSFMGRKGFSLGSFSFFMEGTAYPHMIRTTEDSDHGPVAQNDAALTAPEIGGLTLRLSFLFMWATSVSMCMEHPHLWRALFRSLGSVSS